MIAIEKKNGYVIAASSMYITLADSMKITVMNYVAALYWSTESYPLSK